MSTPSGKFEPSDPYQKEGLLGKYQTLICEQITNKIRQLITDHPTSTIQEHAVAVPNVCFTAVYATLTILLVADGFEPTEACDRAQDLMNDLQAKIADLLLAHHGITQEAAVKASEAFFGEESAANVEAMLKERAAKDKAPLN